MAAASEKKIFIIAGPNGAGKTTFATEFLSNEADCPAFINADLIAAGLNPFRPNLIGVRAGRPMLGRIREYLSRGENFTFETTLTDAAMRAAFPAGPKRAIRSSCSFCGCRRPSWRLRASRAGRRSRRSRGDDSQTIPAGRRNFERLYRDIVDGRALYDNSGDEPKLLAEEERMSSEGGEPKQKPRYSDFIGAEATMRRAAKRARRRAE